MRKALLVEAAAAFPQLGGEVLPHLLQPLQERRYTALQLVGALGEMSTASPSPHCQISDLSVATIASPPTIPVPEGQKLKCCICWGEFSPTDGYTCPAAGEKLCNHFACWTCLGQAYATAENLDAVCARITGGGDLICFNVACKCPITLKMLYQPDAPPPLAILQAQEQLRIGVVLDRAAREARGAERRLLEAENARLQAIADRDERAATELRMSIVDDALTLRCPRCKAVFLDFCGSCALTCYSRDCSAAFCAWCLKDCGKDAHGHVARCPDNGGAGGLFATQERINAGQNSRKIRLVRQVMQKAQPTARARELLRIAMRQDLQDLGIAESEVFD
jgi:hypothetical protein